MTFYVNAEVEACDIAGAINNQEEAFDLIVRIVENFSDGSFDQRLINMLRGADE